MGLPVSLPPKHNKEERFLTSRTPFGITSLEVFSIELNGFDETGQNGDRNGNVADGDQNSDDFRETLQPGRVDGMAEAERLKHAPQAMIEVIAKHDHSDDVEE